MINLTHNRYSNVKGLQGVLDMPTPLKSIVVNFLATRDLSALNIALGRGNVSVEKNKSPMMHLKRLVNDGRDIPLKQILKGLFTTHPGWESISSTWPNVPLNDKIWLLRIHELHDLKIVRIDEIKHPLSHKSPSLLEHRTNISLTLSQVKTVNLADKGLKTCPDSICLLINVSNLKLSRNNLTTPPDLRPFPGLKLLNLRENQLTISPDLSHSKQLEILDLGANQITVAPNLQDHLRVTHIDLNHNKIRSLPLINANAKLQILCILQNPLLPDEVTKAEELNKKGAIIS